MSRKSLFLTLCAAAVLLALTVFVTVRTWAAPAAFTFTVDTQLDLTDTDTTDGRCLPGSCSLRAAIMQADVIPNADVTIIVPSGAYTLTRPPAGADGPENGDLNLTTPPTGNPLISIVGAGAASTIIDANQIDRVLSVDKSRKASISGVTLRHGNVISSGEGGGIRNDGDLTLTQVTVTANQAAAGGGLYCPQGTLSVVQSTISDNSAEDGGGLYNTDDGCDETVSVIQSTFSLNHATHDGGAIYNAQALKLVNSTISHNSAGGDGSGIYNFGALEVINSTISQNNANHDGGGIWNDGTANVYNTTVVFNEADVDQEGGTGGGLWNTAGKTFNIRQTLVAGNTATEPRAGFDDCTGTIDAFGWNLFWMVSGCTVNTFTLTWGTLSSLADIGPLQNNGGPTLTHALLAGSNAIDSGAVAASCVTADGPLTTDQRGLPRPADGDNDGSSRCDIGAFEVQGDTPPVANPQTVNAVSGQVKAITLTASDADGDPLTYDLIPQPPHGKLNGSAPNLTYKSANGFVGDDHFSFMVNDGITDSVAATVTIHVTAAPVSNTPPVANPQSVNAVSGQAKSIHLTASDADGDMLGFEVVSQPAHGALSGLAPSLTYTSTSGFVGDDHFSFKVNDGTADSPTAQVTIHVTATPAPNTPPVANPQSVNDASGQAKTIILTASDADGDPLTYSLVSQPAHGVLKGTAPNLTYTPASGFAGNDHFSFKVNDGTVDSPATQVTIVVKSGGPVSEDKVYLPLTRR